MNNNFRLNSAGGLVTAVAPVVVECRGTWIGWSGLHDVGPDTPIPEADRSWIIINYCVEVSNII